MLYQIFPRLMLHIKRHSWTFMVSVGLYQFQLERNQYHDFS